MIRITRPSCPNRNALNQGNYKDPINKNALETANYHKCMYCESYISNIYYGDIEHIKPKSKYPDLEFDWENLGFVCAKCNNAKSNKYEDETPYINPYIEDPSTHIFVLGALLLHKHGSERGQLTISDIQLNRASLVERRNEQIRRIQNTIDSCFRTQNETLKNNALEALREEYAEDKEYSLTIYHLFINQNLI